MKKAAEASNLFLHSERAAGNNNKPSSSRTLPQQVSQDLIKCFCGICESFFKRKSIEYALKSNGHEILRDNDARNILRKFAIYHKKNSPFKTILEEILDCFELSQAILNGEKDLEENKTQLEDACYTEYWEEYLEKAIEEDTTDSFLQDLMRDSGTRLENSDEYPIFKEELKKKLNVN